MSWTLDDYVKKCFSNEPVKQRIARELAKFRHVTPIQQDASIKLEQIGFTSKKITRLIGEDESNDNAVHNVRRHLAGMNEYIGTVDIEPREDVKRTIGRPSKRYFLNDHFWEEFHTREPETSAGFSVRVVHPTPEQRIENERAQAAEELARKGDDKGFYQLIEMLDDDSENARTKAALALGNLRDPRAFDHLVAAYEDGKLRPSVFITALVSLQDSRAVDPLVSMMLEGIEIIQAIRALGQIGDVRAVDPLASMMLNSKNVPIRMRAAIALGDIGDEKAEDPLNEALNDPEKSVRDAAKRALEKIKNK